MKASKTNMWNIKTRFSPWAWLMLIAISVIYILINYAGTEGLNPTDDGVVLAQSWRILQGEIPHLDFISIRPAGSGFLHTIHFLLPFPLEISARYFVLFQFFIIAFSWVQFFRLKTSFKHEIPTIYKLSLLLIAWITSIFNYNLFPWTTIDAIFWTSIGFYLSERAFHIRRPTVSLGIGLFAFTMAALSRQTFAVVTIIGWVWIAVRLYYRKLFKKAVISAFIGLIPVVLYALMIALNDAGQAFIRQIAGRTEFYEPAIKTYYDWFKLSKLMWLNLSIIVLSIILGVAKRFSMKLKSFFATLPAMRVIFIIETALVLFIIYSTGEYFITAETRNVFTLPFNAFWILIDILFINIFIQDNKFNSCIPAWFGIFVAWISSISLGCNTPVFAYGILMISILYVYLIKYQDTLLLNQTWLNFLLPIIAIGLLITGTFSQRNINYRDVSFNEQTHSLNEVNNRYGNIKTNKYTFRYFKEVDSLINQFEDERIVFIPDNAIIYPVYRLKNPMPLDWNQKAEYTGQEKQYNKYLSYRINENVIFFIQKYNTKKMYNGFDKLKEDKYPNIKTIKNRCKLIDETDYFRIYRKDQL